MKRLSTLLLAATVSLMSASALAQTVVANARTLDDAEAIIAAKAQQAGAKSYTIIEAYNGNHVHMTAVLHN